MKQLDPNIISMLIGFYIFLFVIFLTILYVTVRYRRSLKEKENLKSMYEEQMLRSRIEMQEQTLSHVSRELHDNLGQLLSLLKINLGTLKLDDSEKSRAKFEDSKEILRTIIADVKALSTSLNTTKIQKIGLITAVENDLEKINSLDEFVVHSNIERMVFNNKDSELILFRMIQEVLNNTIKHSNAKNIFVSIKNENNTFVAKISDDGKGFDVSKVVTDSNSGNGLINLKARAEVINGTYVVTSKPGGGTQNIITVPMQSL